MDNTEQIIKKLEQIEQRLSKLETSSGLESLPIEAKGKVVAQITPNDEPSAPVGSIISLVIGGLILLFNVPSFLFRNLFYSYQNSYYGGGLDFFSILLIGLGLFLVAIGIRGISKYRSEQASGVFHKKTAIFQPTNSLEINSEAKKNQEEKPKEKPEDSIEYQIASHWFSIVGIIAILFGVVFFLKYAFDNQWIGPAGQVSIGIIFGMILLAAGERFRIKYAKYSQIITGGGLGVLYLSVFAAYGVFHLVDASSLLFGMSLVTICAALLAVHYNALAIAVLAVLGGFATPVLLSGGIESQLLLLSYVVILNLGVLFVAFFKNWRPLNILTFISTYFVFTTWYGSHYDPTKFLTTFVFLTILFFIFSFVWVVYNLIYEKAVEEQDILLMVLNAVVYFGFSYSIFSKNYADYLGFFAFALAVYYFVFGYIAYSKFKAESALTLGLLGISIIFLTVAVPFQVKKNLITLIWTAEAAVILWLGFWLSSYKLRVSALAIYVLVVIRLLAFDSIIPIAEFQLLINRRFLTYFAVAVSAGIASWFYWKNKGKTQADESVVLPALLIGLNIIMVVALTLESYSYFGAKIFELNKKLYRSEVPTAVLGQQTIVKAIESPFDDISVACNGLSNNGVFLGVSEFCDSPAKITTKFLFTNLAIPPNARITAAYLTIVPLDGSQVNNNSYSIVLKNGTLGSNSLGSPSVVWQAMPWKSEVALTTGDFAYSVQSVLNNGGWQQGNSLLVIIEPISTVAKKEYRIYSYEQDPQKAAKLTVTYSTPDTGGIQADPYTQNKTQNNTLNTYQNNYRAAPTPYSSQNVYRNNQPDPVVQAEIKNLTVARNFSMSIIWLLYSLILIVIGVVNKYKPIRLSALAFFAITILKIFLVDSSNLDKIFRIIAFIGLGTILLIVAYIYQRYKDKINAFLL